MERMQKKKQLLCLLKCLLCVHMIQCVSVIQCVGVILCIDMILCAGGVVILCVGVIQCVGVGVILCAGVGVILCVGVIPAMLISTSSWNPHSSIKQKALCGLYRHRMKTRRCE